MLYKGACLLLKHAAARRRPVVIITNQSGISRCLVGLHVYADVNNRMLYLLGTAAPLAALYPNEYVPGAALSGWCKP